MAVVTTKYAPLFPCYSPLAMVIPLYQLHSPVATTGDFLLRGNPTVQCTHCALQRHSCRQVLCSQLHHHHIRHPHHHPGVQRV